MPRLSGNIRDTDSGETSQHGAICSRRRSYRSKRRRTGMTRRLRDSSRRSSIHCAPSPPPPAGGAPRRGRPRRPRRLSGRTAPSIVCRILSITRRCFSPMSAARSSRRLSYSATKSPRSRRLPRSISASQWRYISCRTSGAQGTPSSPGSRPSAWARVSNTPCPA